MKTRKQTPQGGQVTMSIAISLRKDLYLLAKDVPIPSGCLFGDDINARINNIEAPNLL